LEFDGDKIVFKDWRDHGHDPNRTEVPAHEFLAGALHDEIRTELGQAVHDEALESVQLLNSTMRSGRNWVRLCTTKLSSLFSY
jgi:hypothetical protein